MRPRLTFRGGVVACAVVVAIAANVLFGARSLETVAAPATCVVVVAGLLVLRAGPPRVVRDPPGDGHIGETRAVGLAVEGSGTVVALARDRLEDGLEGDPVVRTVPDGRRTRYPVTLDARGYHEIGPVAVTLRDPFGLWERTHVVDDRYEVTVYPRIVPLEEPPRALVTAAGLAEERTAFSGVREYHHGDPLRDVNWKASAKRTDGYVVTTYEGDGASANLAVALLDAGAAVGLVTTDGSLEPATGGPHRRRVLDLLAGLGEGTLAPAARAETRVVVRADRDGITVTVDDEPQRLDGLTAGAFA